jgi:HTH-type transcriptional regulator / antitoxin HipB
MLHKEGCAAGSGNQDQKWRAGTVYAENRITCYYTEKRITLIDTESRMNNFYAKKRIAARGGLRFMEQIARTAKQLANILRQRRTELGLTQVELASRIALRQSTVSALETSANVRTATLLSGLAALDLEMIVRPRTKTSAKDIEAIF